MSYRGERTVSYIPEALYHNDRDREIERLRRKIEELKLELRGRQERRNPEGLFHKRDATGEYIEGSNLQQ